MKNQILLISVFLLMVILIYTSITFKEGFTWNQESSQNFIAIQHSINPQIIFDINQIQKQASQQEVDYFNKYNLWPWTEKTKELYIEAITHNPYIRISPISSLNYAMTIYNETAILRILYYQTKEGQFLLHGIVIKSNEKDLPSGFGDFPYLSGLKSNTKNDIIKCNMNTPSVLESKNNGILDYRILENIIPGFTFLQNPCNPCTNIDENANNLCQFDLKGYNY